MNVPISRIDSLNLFKNNLDIYSLISFLVSLGFRSFLTFFKYIPSSIKTSTDDIWNTEFKPSLLFMVGLIPYGFGILLLITAIYYIQRRIRKGY